MDDQRLRSKIAIGTVQFGLDYGISNTEGKTSEQEVKSILKYAKEQGIGILDTAMAYGDSESVLGRNADESFKITSKFPGGISAEKLRSVFDQSRNNLQRDSLYGYIAHNARDLIEDRSLWDQVVDLKTKGLVEKVGYSLYTPEELDQLLEVGCIPDLVQVTYNLLDDKFERHMALLKEHRTEVHVRSVFLQGLFFMESLPEKLRSLSGAVSAVRQIAESYNMSTVQLLLNYALHHPAIDAVVIGVNNRLQLEQNITSVINDFPYQEIRREVRNIAIADKHLLNPVNWK
jgi:aryl-alcohol dehydrogenase-like predicted oxidoreductase